MVLRVLVGSVCLALVSSCSEPSGPAGPGEHAERGGAAEPAGQAGTGQPGEGLRPQSPPLFRARREWSLGGKPEHLVAADLDGDGRAELAATLIDRPALLVWSGTAAGLDRAPRELAVGGWPLRPIALPPGAFGAAQGRRLVAVASRAERALALHDLTGDAPPRELWRGPTPRALALGDVDADGVRELALATDGRALVLVGENGTVRMLPLPHELPTCALVLASGRGVVVGFQDARSLAVIAPASSAPPAELELDGIPRDLVELDLDGDGALELVAVGGDADAWVFAQDGAQVARFEVGSIPVDAEVADLDGDGAPELAVLALLGLSYELAGGWSEGRPARVCSGYAGQTPTSMALADLDGDGRLDLAVANRDSLALSCWSGDGSGGMIDAIQTPAGGAPNALALGDLAGDALPELAVLGSKSQTLTVLGWAGSGYERLAERGLAGSPQALALADLEGDARPEIAVLTDASGGSQVELYALSDGALAPLGVRPVPARGEDLVAVGSGGDGRPELWVAAPDAGQVIRLSADGAAAFPVPSVPVALCPVQFDADATPELAVALGVPGPRKGIAVLDLRPGGEVVELGVVEAAGWPVGVVAGQLNGDETQDGAVLALEEMGSARGLVQPLRGELAVALHPRRAHPTGAGPAAIAVGDLDGDGREDVVVASQNGHVIDVWLAVVSDEGVLGLQRVDDVGAHLGCLDVVVGDLNGDGLLDLAVANGFSDDVSAILGRPR